MAQLLNVITLPILSRIYSPADFGVMAAYASVIAIMTEFSGFRYHLAIPLPKHARYANALACLSLLIQIVMIFALAIAFFIGGNELLKMLSLESLIRYKYLIPFGLLAIGVYNILSQLAIRESLFQALGKTKILQTFSGLIVKMVMGMLGMKPFGLLCGTIIGTVWRN